MTTLNVGNLERALRILFGLGLIALAATDRIGVWGYAGVMPLVTGFVAWCPLYRLFGFRTTSR